MPIRPDVVCAVHRHPDPVRPFLRSLRSYTHLDGDPQCRAVSDDAPDESWPVAG